LTKSNAQKLGSHLKNNNLLAPHTHFSFYRNREKDIALFYSTVDKLCFCNDISGLLRHLNQSTRSEDWFLFMDSSSKSFKAVLINKKSLYVVPVAYTTATKETRELIETVLESISYNDFLWEVCCDFKMISILVGLQAGYVQYACFLCQWRSRAKDQYETSNWPLRQAYATGFQNIQYNPLVPTDKIRLPPLHIKLGIFKNFIKALDRESESVKRLHQIFPNLSEAKLTAAILNGPDIRKLTSDLIFPTLLSSKEKLAWESMLDVSQSFLGEILFHF